MDTLKLDNELDDARTDDFGKVADVYKEEGWSEYGTVRYSRGNRKIL